MPDDRTRLQPSRFDQLRARQCDAWRDGEPVMVEELLSSIHPDRISDDDVLELVYGEVCLREEINACKVSAEEYLNRFPILAEQLRQLLEMHRVLDEVQDSELVVKTGHIRDLELAVSRIKGAGSIAHIHDRTAGRNRLERLLDIVAQAVGIMRRGLEKHEYGSLKELSEKAQLTYEHCAAIAQLHKGLAHLEATPAAAPETVASAQDRPGAQETAAFEPGSLSSGESGGLFGDYEILQVVAQGGMGVVYKALQTKLNRIVALKMIRSAELASETEVKRFYTEAEAAAKLGHPNIVSVYEVGEARGQHYFSMAFVDGESLSDRVLRDGPLPPKEAARLVHEAAGAVHHAHGVNVIHRDLKPQNLMIDRHDKLHVTDFGLAKLQQAATELTATGQVLGTPAFMPPEQARGRMEQVGILADVYSLGATLYFLLTGRPPFQASTVADTLRQVLDNEPAPPRQLNSSIPRDLETICLKALRKERASRYANAQQLAEDLERWLSGKAIVARRVRTAERAWKWCKRKPVIAGLSAAILLVTIFGSAVFWERQNAAYADGLVESLLVAEPEEVQKLIIRLEGYWHWAEPALRRALLNEGEDQESDRATLHARLALAARDDSLAPTLIENLFDVDMVEVGNIRNALKRSGTIDFKKLWDTFRNESQLASRRLRCGLALAGLAPNADDWKASDHAFLVEQLVTSNPVHQPELLELLTDIGGALIEPLDAVFSDSASTESEQIVAANALAEFGASDSDRMATWLTKATAAQYDILYRKFATTDANLAALKSLVSQLPTEQLDQIQRIDLGKQRASAAILLLREGERESIFEVFRVRDDPEALTQFVRRCRPRGISPKQLLELLERAHAERQSAEKDKSKAEEQVVFGILLALGEFTVSDFAENERARLIERLTQWHAQDPSSAIHGASGWLLRHWGFEQRAAKVDQTPTFDHVPSMAELKDREWFVLGVDVPRSNAANQTEGPGRIFFTFVMYPAGSFLLGAPDDEHDTDIDQKHYQFELSRPIAVSDREVTWRQFRPYDGDSHRADLGKKTPQPLSDEHPVTIVTWFEAVHYCQRLTLWAGLHTEDQCFESIELPPSAALGAVTLVDNTAWPLKGDWLDRPGFRLLTESEWEYVCRSGTRTPYSFGSDKTSLDHYGWFDENADQWSQPVGRLRPNLRGLLDIHGNVFEWCYDRLAVKPQRVLTDPIGPSTGSERLARGGAWYGPAADCRSAFRPGIPASRRITDVGFRLAFTPSKGKRTKAVPNSQVARPTAKLAGRAGHGR